MATNVIRTVTDEATDALAAIRDAEDELARLRQHIEQVKSDPDDSEGVVYQALRSGHIVEARVADALRHTGAMRSLHLSVDA